MAGDVAVDSLGLLRQYQGHFRNFADCVDLGVVGLRDWIKSKKEELLEIKTSLDRQVSVSYDKIDDRIKKLEEYDYRYDFGSRDSDRIEIEKQRLESQRIALEAHVEQVKEKIERQIGILDDMWNLSYSYGNKTREMSDSANGSLTQIIETLSKYRSK